MTDPRTLKAGIAPKSEEHNRPDTGADRSSSERTELSATEARQGEIILGRHGRWIWIGSFAAIVILLLLVGFF